MSKQFCANVFQLRYYEANLGDQIGVFNWLFFPSELKKKTLTNQVRVFTESLRFLSCWINADFFTVTTKTFEFYNAVDFRKKSVVASTAYVFTWINLCTALTVKD